MLSIVGPAGVGKTTLARAALESASATQTEVRWIDCELATKTDAAGLCAEVARAIGRPLGEQADPFEWVAVGLSAKPTVLVLHAMEKALPEGAGVLSRWLELGAELRIITTSRNAVGDPTEQVLELGPLALPDGASDPAASPAVQLFLRASAARGVTLSASPEVAALVVALDGLPLAIELAASRTPLLSPADMLRWIDRRFELLRDGDRARRGLPHASLEVELAASYAALEAPAQAMLRASSVFVAPFTAEAVGAAAGSADVLDALEALRAASLLSVETVVDDASPRRYRLLAAVRAFAHDALVRAGEEDATALRIAVFHGERAVVLRPALEGEQPDRAERAILAERPDFSRSTLRLLAARRIDLAVATFVALRHASRRIDDPSGLEALAVPLEAALSAADPVTRVEGFYVLATHAMRLGRFSQTAERARELRRVAPPGSLRATSALRLEGAAAASLGALDEAQRAYEVALAEAERGPHVPEIVAVRHGLGALHRRRGDGAAAREHIRVAIDLAGELGPRSLADVLVDAAAIDLELGDVDLARREVERAFEAIRQSSYEQSRLPVVLTLMDARIHHASGDVDGAHERYERAAEMAGLRGDPLIERVCRLYGAITTWERGEVRVACDRLREEVSGLEKLERTHATWMRALLGGGEALLGNPSEAERAIREATVALRSAGAERMADAAEGCLGFLDVASAHEAASRNDVEAAAAHKDCALQRRSRLMSEGRPPAMEAMLVARLLQRSLDAPRPRIEPRTLEVDDLGAWFSVGGGQRIACAKRPTMKRMLMALVKAHVSRPGDAIDRAGLLDAGWPGERMMARAAQRRLEVMISRMRELGLRDVLETTDGGYRIVPSCRVELHRRSS